MQGNYDDNARFQVFVFTIERYQVDLQYALKTLNEYSGTEIILDPKRFNQFKELCTVSAEPSWESTI